MYKNQIRWSPALLRHNQHGFTLIELVIVMVVIAILGITGIAAYRLLYVKTDLNNIAQGIAIDISTTRLESVAAREGDSYGVRFYNNRYELIRGISATAYKTHNLPSDVTITTFNLTGTSNQIMFDKLTGFTSNHGSVTLSTNGEIATISITPQGVISVEP